MLGRSDNLLTFFVGGEQVAPLTEDQAWDVIAGTALVSGALPFYVVTRAQQRVQVTETTINAPGSSTDAMGSRAIGGLAGLGLLAVAALVAVRLTHAVKRHVPRLACLDQRVKLEEEHREYRHAYAEHLGFNSDGASLLTSPCWGCAIRSPGRMYIVPFEPKHWRHTRTTAVILTSSIHW